MPVVMGTAGHIDHGKTTLIRTLTGIDCDRLVEEKRRGITIELGFAELPLPGGATLSVVDVPGHEKFVRTMVAGAAGVDFVLLVIAADEGVMPQTREHLEICSLLGISSGIVALTKSDMVDEEMLELAREDVAELLAHTAFVNAPIIAVSAQTGAGLDDLKQALAQMEQALAPARSQDIFRLPVDRVFTLKGHGTVITGTMIAGSVSLGDVVELYPGGRTSKVRGLQSHGHAVETALSGRRTAVNIPDLAVDEVNRGDVMSHPETLFPAQSWVLELRCLPSSPRALRHRAEVHFHHGARELQARLYFADREKLEPGDSCICEVRFTEPAVAVFGDRCVVRSFSPLRTVAGGVVLNPLSVDMRRRGKGFAERCALLQTLAPGECAQKDATLEGAEGSACNAPVAGAPVSGLLGPAQAEARVKAQLLVTLGAELGLSFSRLKVLANLDSRALEKAIAGLTGKQEVFCFDKELKLYIAAERLAGLYDSCVAEVAAFHKKFSEKQGIRRSELTTGWGKSLPPKLVHFVIERLVKQGRLTAEGDSLKEPAHKASFSNAQAPLSEAILKAYKDAGLAPPNQNEVLEALGANKKDAASVFAAYRENGQLVRVAEGIWYYGEHLKSAEDAVRTWFADNETLTLADLKNITGLSRKYLVALLEYFDTRRITMRVGDARVLRDK